MMQPSRSAATLTIRSARLALVVLAALVVAPAAAQDVPPADPPAARVAPPPALPGEDEPAAQPTSDIPAPAQESASPLKTLLGPTRVSTTLDTYYEYNANRPASGANVLRNFDEKDNQFSLSYFELAFEQVPTDTRRFGFRADLGFGPTATWVGATDPDEGRLKYLQQGYASYLAPVGKGIQVDAGKFVTPLGAEYIETSGNWNYSRSLLFAWAIPYYHVGMRATTPLSDKVSVAGFLLNGWNNAVDNNRGKTVGAQVTLKPIPALSIAQGWMGGPEGPNGSAGWRQVFDTVATWTVSPRLSLMGNADFGRDEIAGEAVTWSGVAAYAKVSVLPTWSLIPRVEVFEDAHGFSTGTAQTLREITLTSDHALTRGLSARIEYRRDWSNTAFFEYREDQFRRSQNTILVGLIYTLATH